FFFSSRRRHTRFDCDWSSDVCSSDLIWTDIPVINNRSNEALGYPTQKPLALLERILKTSSREGDVVLDPCCGCGTTIAASEKLRSEERRVGKECRARRGAEE